jgi:hypothetical protein
MNPTPFGPLPPSQPAPEPANESPPAPPAAQSEPPQAQPAIRSLTPSRSPVDASPSAAGQTDADETDAGIILDPIPWTDPDETGDASAQESSWPGWARPAEGKSLLPGMLLALGVMVALLVVMRHLRRRQSARPLVPAAPDRIASIHERAAGSIGPVERAMADAEQLARRLAATMENKAARLELLLEESDRKLEELNKAISQASRAAPAGADRARPARSIDPSLLDLARVEQDRAERNGFQEHKPQLSAPAETGPARTPGPASGQSHQPAEPADPVHRRVWALADDGMRPLDIARSLNQPIGQVELILNLRRSG